MMGEKNEPKMALEITGELLNEMVRDYLKTRGVNLNAKDVTLKLTLPESEFDEARRTLTNPKRQDPVVTAFWKKV